MGDCSASANLSESEIDERVAALFELEEPSLLYDLCDHFSGRQSKFDVFWQRAKEYLEEEETEPGLFVCCVNSTLPFIPQSSVRVVEKSHLFLMPRSLSYHVSLLLYPV